MARTMNRYLAFGLIASAALALHPVQSTRAQQPAGIPWQGRAGDPVHGRGVGRELPAARPPAVFAEPDCPGDRETSDTHRRSGV